MTFEGSVLIVEVLHHDVPIVRHGQRFLLHQNHKSPTVSGTVDPGGRGGQVAYVVPVAASALRAVAALKKPDNLNL